MAASMVITTNTSIMIKPPVPNDCANPINPLIKPTVLNPCAKTPAATNSITTLANASAMPRYATSRPLNTCLALKLRTNSIAAANSMHPTSTVMMCSSGPHLPSKSSTPRIGVNGSIA
ncbi:Uncharacterised protein [Serratia marcescens]|nr:Uncharacterised protein [Serratia marcescens]